MITTFALQEGEMLYSATKAEGGMHGHKPLCFELG